MKKRYLILMLLLLSGCTVNYNLDIEGNGIYKETITGTVTNEELDNNNSTDINDFSYNLNFATPLIRDEGEYAKEIIDKKGYKEFSYSYVFDNNYDKSNIINTCFSGVLLSDDDEFYYYDFYGPFKCLYTDKININVTSKYAVIENNADKVNKNTYTWIIDNEDDSDIHLVVSKDVLYQETKEKKIFTSFRIVGFIILVVLSLITYLLYRKKNSDEI